MPSDGELDEWANNVDEVSAQIKGIIDGTITDFDEFDRKYELKNRAKKIREEELQYKRERYFSYGIEGKGAGTNYKWWCKRCFVEYLIDLPESRCTRCKQSDQMMTQAQRREELMGKLETFKQDKAKHAFRKDKWLRWKKSQALLKRSKYINYKAWEYWEPDTDSEEEGDPIVPRDNPEFLAMEADIKSRKKKQFDRTLTARKCRERGNEFMKEGDFLGAIENYEEGLEYRRDDKALWTNKALAELKIFRWHDAITSCNKVIEYSEIFEDGFTKSADACFKAFTRRAQALRALHRWEDAVADLEDAVKLFPKDREAQDLLVKTKSAREEAKAALVGESQHEGREKQSSDEPPGSDGPPPPRNNNVADGDFSTTGVAPRTPAAEAPQVRPDGSVRVTIVESDEEDLEADAELEDVGVDGPARASAIAHLSARDFAALLERLRKSPQERARYCSRGAPSIDVGSSKYETRKVNIKVEEVLEPSALDGVLKDVERCSILWKKHQGQVIPLRADVKKVQTNYDDPIDQKDEAFVRVVTPRALQVLLVLSRNSDHHCELSAAAVRHVWPLLSSETWRHSVLELMLEWSQRSVSAKSLAEFAGRYPSPHLQLLIDAMTRDTKENVLPPGFEKCTQAAAERVDRGEVGIDDALQDVLAGLSAPSMAELAVSTLGNICLAGQLLPVFKEQLSPFCSVLVTALSNKLRAFDWRLCGRAAGALCNMVRLGDVFVMAVHEQCVEPLVKALREESSQEGASAFLKALHAQGGANMMPGSKSTGRVLGALVNLLVVRPAAAKDVLDQGGLEVSLPLIDPKGEAALRSAGDDATAAEVAARASLLVNRLVAASPSTLSAKTEGELLCSLRVLLERDPEFTAVTAAGEWRSSSGQALDSLDLTVRLLTTILVKTPGALARLVAASSSRRPKIEELPDDYDVSGARGRSADAMVSSSASWEISELVTPLVKLLRMLQPRAYLTPDDEGTAPSRLRGNLALLFGAIAEAQNQEDAPPVLRELDLSALVPILIDTLRKERNKVQHNVGVCVTRLAQNQRYRKLVRDLNGIETLHQVQLPRVEAQKEKAMKLHRIQGPLGLD